VSSAFFATIAGCGKTDVPKEAAKADAGVSVAASDGGDGGTPEEVTPAPLTDAQKKVVEIMRFEQGRVLGKTGMGLPLYAADKDPQVRKRAARAIGRVGEERGLRTLELLLGDKDSAVKAEAAFAVAMIVVENGAEARKRGLAAILKAWSDGGGDEGFRVALVWTMRKMGGKDSVGLAEALGQALRNPSAKVRATAMVSTALLVRSKAETPGISGDALIKPITVGAGETDAALREPAIYALMMMKNPAHSEVLRQVIDRKITERERSMAIRGLTAMKKFDLGLMRGVLLPPPDPTQENPEPVDRRGEALTQVSAISHVVAEGGADAAKILHEILDDFLPGLIKHGRDLATARFHVLLAVIKGAPRLTDDKEAARLLDRIREFKGIGLGADASFGELLNERTLGCVFFTASSQQSGAVKDFDFCKGAPGPKEVALVETIASLTKVSKKDRAKMLLEVYENSKLSTKVAALAAANEFMPKEGEKGSAELLTTLETLALAGMKDEDTSVRSLGIQLAGGLGVKHFKAVDSLLSAHDAAKDPARGLDEVLAALDALGKFKMRDGITVVRTWTTNPSHVVRRRAAEALKSIDEKEEVGHHMPSLAQARPDWVVAAPVEVVMRTTRGNIAMTLRPDLAPATVDNFLSLAKKGFYDGLMFHRVIANFVAQGGDPNGDGNGGPGYTLPAEWSMAKYEAGVLGMAHAGKDTGGSQFFITQAPHPHLDGGYTVFGRVTAGMESVLLLQKGDKIVGVDVKER
jgi:cyclophilin family peptidyl-prolyl cis-trans isomerase/HEAT repeat protein